MDKRIYILLGAGVILIFLIVLTIALSPKQKRQSNEYLQTGQPPSQNATIEQLPQYPSRSTEPYWASTTPLESLGKKPPTAVGGVSPSPISGSVLEETAKGFYDWYVSQPDPLGSGDYQKIPYISVEYKKTMSGFVVRGDYLNSDPVFTCVGVKPPKNIITQREVYDDTEEKAYILIQEDMPGAKPLYKIIFHKVNEQWFIDDIRCTH